MTAETPDMRAAKPRRRTMRGLRHAVRVALRLAVFPVVFVLIAAVMMIGRDIAAPSWITARVAEMASQVMGGGQVTFGTIYVHVGRDLHPRVRLIDTVVQDAEGATIARISQISGGMSPRGLLQGDVLMQDVALTGAQIDLRRNADGTVAVAFETGAAAPQNIGRLTDLFDRIEQVLDRPALAALRTVSANGLVVNFADARAGRAWTVDGGSATVDLRGDQTNLRADMSVLSGRDAVTTLALTYARPRGSKAAQIGLAITDAVAADIAAQSPALNWLSDFDAPLTANLRTGLDETGALLPLNATLELGAGALQPNAETAPVTFASAKAYLVFDPATDRIQFDQIAVVSDLATFAATGQAFLRDSVNGLPQTLIGQFAFTDITLTPDAQFPAPLRYPAAQVDFRLGLAPFKVDIGQIYLADDGLALFGRGQVNATPAGWEVAVDLRSDTITQAAIMKIWPLDVKVAVREWAARALHHGAMSRFQMALRQRPDHPLIMSAGYEFSNTTMSPMATLPPITNASGVLRFGEGRFSVALDAGFVTPSEGGPLNVAGATMVIPDTTQLRAPTRLDLVFAGSMTATMALLDAPPFGYPSRANVPRDFAQGQVTTRLGVNLPMASTFAPGEITFDVDADLRNVRTSQLVPGRQLAADALTLTADATQMALTGTITVDGLPLSGTWRKPFDGSGNSAVSATFELSPNALATFNIGLPDGAISGTAQGQLDLTLRGDGTTGYTLTSALRGLAVQLPALNWGKAADTAGDLRVEGTLGPTPAINLLALSAPGLIASGRIALRADGTLDQAIFTDLRVGSWLNAPVTLVGRGPQQPFGVIMRGGQVNLHQAQFGSGGAETGPMSVALDRLQLTDGIGLTRFIGEFDGAGGLSGQFTGRVNDEADIQGTVAPQNGRSAVRIRSNDAGGVARAAGLIRNAVGGTLDVTLLPVGAEGNFDGAAAVRGVRIQDAPAMAALLDAISVVGLLQQLDGQGLSFDTVDAQFRVNPQQIILTEASAVGPGLGISLDGIYTLATKQMDFQGVISPFYFINSIGSVLTRRGEGLIGFNFSVIGPVTAPRISVNPLSAFTPGMFRELFRRAPPEVTQ